MSRPRPEHRPSTRRLAVGALGLALVTTACVEPDEPGVDIQALQADVAFGFEAPAEDAPIELPTAVPAQAAQQGRPVDTGTGALTVPFRNTLPDRFNRFTNLQPPAPEVECPTAPIGSSPATQAPEEVTTVPEVGVYRWKRDITTTSVGAAGEITVQVEGFETRAVRAVEELGAGTAVDTDDPSAQQGMRYRYETLAPLPSGLTELTTWTVNTAPVAAGANVTQDPEGVTMTAEGAASEITGEDVDVPDEAQEQLPGGQRIQTGEPNRGLVLNQVENIDANGANQGSFNPSSPLLYLPLPVQAGEFWTSTAVDPTSGETRRIEGQVNERRSVDACGTLLDGWLVEVSETRATAAGTVTIEAEYVVSTELGALVIGETSLVTDALGNSVDATYERGQVEADPLPEDLR